MSNDKEIKSAKYRDFLLNIKNLPSVPLVLMEVSRSINNPVASAIEIGKVINRDQGLVAKILTVANSPLYGIPRRVSTIEFAIVILGLEQIRNIIIAMSMLDSFGGKSDSFWNKHEYWVHSMVTASAAKRIAEDLGYERSGEAFTAGLLHDLGISVIQRYFNNEFMNIIKRVGENSAAYLNAEEEILGLTHQDIGKILCERWNLPPALGDAIAFHHYPSRSSEYKILASIVHLADYMTCRLEAGKFRWDKDYEFDQGAIETLRLGDQEYLNRFIESYKQYFSRNPELLSW